MAPGFIPVSLPGRTEPVIGQDGSDTLWHGVPVLFSRPDLVLAVAIDDRHQEPATRAAVRLAGHVLSLAP
jgi:hypothetical protein